MARGSSQEEKSVMELERRRRGEGTKSVVSEGIGRETEERETDPRGRRAHPFQTRLPLERRGKEQRRKRKVDLSE